MASEVFFLKAGEMVGRGASIDEFRRMNRRGCAEEELFEHGRPQTVKLTFLC